MQDIQRNLKTTAKMVLPRATSSVARNGETGSTENFRPLSADMGAGVWSEALGAPSLPLKDLQNLKAPQQQSSALSQTPIL